MAGKRQFPLPTIGQNFGRLTVIEVTNEVRATKRLVKCVCFCGKEVLTREDTLRRGDCQSCGCITRLKISGQKFGELTALKFIGENRKGESLWNFQCSCGKIVERNAAQTKNHNVKLHCGCKNLGPSEPALRALYGKYKYSAEKRGFGFFLTKEEFRELTSKNCAYCGQHPSQFLNRKGFKQEYIYNGIDRIDNALGYTSENSITCCKVCNVAKATYTEEYFLNWVNKAFHHLESKGIFNVTS